MGLSLGRDLHSLLRPQRAFQYPAPALGLALGQMLGVWMPLALLQALVGLWQGLRSYEALRRGDPGAFTLLRVVGLAPEGRLELLRALPPLPGFEALWPWLLVLVPLGVLGTWLHHAVWDHTGLWLLGGLKTKRGFRVSLVAEAEALRITAPGILIGFLSFLPQVGFLLTLPLLLLEGYLWLFRGVALAARHGCEPWKGVAATIIHGALLGCCGIGLILLTLSLLGLSA